MAVSDLVNFSALLDDAKCVALVRQHRWPEGVCCPGCGKAAVIWNGHDEQQPHRQRYRCKACHRVSTIAPARRWRDIISRCGCGSCAFT